VTGLQWNRICWKKTKSKQISWSDMSLGRKPSLGYSEHFVGLVAKTQVKDQMSTVLLWHKWYIKPMLGNRFDYLHSATYNLDLFLSWVANTHLDLITGLRLERWNGQHPNNHVGHHKLSGPFFFWLSCHGCFAATQLAQIECLFVLTLLIFKAPI